ncbi:unnamed protein product [Adineta steineri]|uniref:EGF-like domain-containing protein n=1 Tax=Adineta steineri TaxID=433720 RepID=A0A814BRK9_9BILA|nr:unnamed protein product [Adineta steineri]
MQHDCLYHATASIDNNKKPYQIIRYCLSEWASEWKIENSRDENFTFSELRNRNITGQQLYLWSAPLDLIERYQFYLNQPLNSTKTDIETELFYNCTFPWFGPVCQYMFDQYESNHSSFAAMIHDFYQNGNDMNSLTCYTHLQCDRGTSLICLDWTDICNGIIDCLDGGQDEEDCWQLEVNDCLENEYRCSNGQCISKDFYQDDDYNTGDMINLDCLDGSDELFDDNKRNRCARREPTFQCEEATCRISPIIDIREFKTLSSSSCVNERGKLLMQAMLSVKENSVNDTCWRALMCIAFTLMVTEDSPCYGFCYPGSCTHYIENNCPDFILLPAHVSFQTICDGFTELWPVTIEGREETDETQCEQWPCNNVYTQCNGIWNCLNGADELNCNTTSPQSNCTSHQHLCVSPITNKFMCLPIEQANDDSIGCLGATDEPRNPCHNRGKCMPVDENIASDKFTCICPEGFSGDTCQINDTKIVVSFEKGITLSQSITVHFIQAFKYKFHERSTIFKKILVDQNSATIYWSYPFAVMLIETSESTYYLAVAQETYVESTTVMSTINPSHRCAHINELFNETFVKSHILHRIKYYHTPCQNSSPRLFCFYDDIHICLCTSFEQQRLANCFEFDHHMKHDCIGQNTCENGAKCFQDNLKCPQASICMCPECFYGTQCQFTTKGFGLSLDAVLGYHIQPHVALQHQSSTVQVSVALTTIMFALGVVNGILSIMTFKMKTIWQVGCGIYLMRRIVLLTVGVGILFQLRPYLQPHPLLALADASCCKVDEIVKTPKTSVGNAANKIIALFVS